MWPEYGLNTTWHEPLHCNRQYAQSKLQFMAIALNGSKPNFVLLFLRLDRTFIVLEYYIGTTVRKIIRFTITDILLFNELM